MEEQMSSDRQIKKHTQSTVKRLTTGGDTELRFQIYYLLGPDTQNHFLWNSDELLWLCIDQIGYKIINSINKRDSVSASKHFRHSRQTSESVGKEENDLSHRVLFPPDGVAILEHWCCSYKSARVFTHARERACSCMFKRGDWQTSSTVTKQVTGGYCVPGSVQGTEHSEMNTVCPLHSSSSLRVNKRDQQLGAWHSGVQKTPATCEDGNSAHTHRRVPFSHAR